MAEGSPTVRRRRLGIELRRLREAAGMTGDEVAKRLECSHSKISKVENGKAVLKSVEVKALLEMYGVAEQSAQEQLLEMARQARGKGWWDTYDDVLPAGFDTYVGLEAEASSLRSFDAQLIHGLLQTEDYARAVIQAIIPGAGTDRINRLVELRMRRQQVLSRTSGPARFKLWAIFDEAVLHRPVGGREIMCAQLRRLIEASQMSNVTLQIVPYAKGAHGGLIGRFAILEFPDLSDLDVVYVDTGAGNLYLEKVRDIHNYAERFDILRADALPVDDSIAAIRAVTKEMQ